VIWTSSVNGVFCIAPNNGEKLREAAAVVTGPGCPSALARGITHEGYRPRSPDPDLSSILRARQGERASVFHGGRERQLRCGRFEPFVKSIRRNQTTAFVDFFILK
jgi:hypothetical protein